MTNEDKNLYERIAPAGSSDGAGVTRAERNIVHQLPAPEEEDRLCTSKVGLTMSELRAKAIASPDSLTEVECRVIFDGADYDSPGRLRNPFWFVHLPPEENELAKRVWDIMDDEPQRVASAREAAAVFRPKRMASLLEKGQRKREEAKRQRDILERANTPKWVNEIRDAGVPRWGFIVFRTAYGEGTDAGWRNFIDTYNYTGKMHLSSCWKISGGLA